MNLKLFTGVRGMDLFEEELTYQGTGQRRIYAGKKVLRILSKKFQFHKSRSGKWYRLTSAKDLVPKDFFEYGTIRHISGVDYHNLTEASIREALEAFIPKSQS